MSSERSAPSRIIAERPNGSTAELNADSFLEALVHLSRLAEVFTDPRYAKDLTWTCTLEEGN